MTGSILPRQRVDANGLLRASVCFSVGLESSSQPTALQNESRRKR